MIAPDHPKLSIVAQCRLLTISRSGFYHRPALETGANLALMRLIDEQFLATPWYDSRQMSRHLRRDGHVAGRRAALGDRHPDTLRSVNNLVALLMTTERTAGAVNLLAEIGPGALDWVRGHVAESVAVDQRRRWRASPGTTSRSH